MRKLLIAGLAAAGLGFSALIAAPAQALPIAPAGVTAAIDQASPVEQARYVCNRWGRCWWRGRRHWRGYGFYGFYRPGWHGRWRHCGWRHHHRWCW
jgi:hypothetical protein